MPDNNTDGVRKESAELEEVRRERNMMRQRNSRLYKKYGLKARRERTG